MLQDVLFADLHGVIAVSQESSLYRDHSLQTNYISNLLNADSQNCSTNVVANSRTPSRIWENDTEGPSSDAVKKCDKYEKAYLSNEFYEESAARLPGPEMLKTLCGRMEGEVKFVRHHNGDISAHQWSNATVSWCHIGQYSFLRKKIEGPMAALQLTDPVSETLMGQEGTLAYFIALAHQCQNYICEASQKPVPPKIPKEDDGLDDGSVSYAVGDSISTEVVPYTKNDIVKKQEAHNYGRPYNTTTSGLDYYRPYASNDGQPFAEVQAIRSSEDPSVALAYQRATNTQQKGHDGLQQLQYNNYLSSNSKHTHRNERNLMLKRFEELIIPQAESRSAHELAMSQEHLMPPRSSIHTGVGDRIVGSPSVPKTAGQNGASAAPAVRTVLYDPLADATRLPNGTPTGYPTRIGSYDNELVKSHTGCPQTKSGSGACLHDNIVSFTDDCPLQCKTPDLRHSIPEPGWKERRVNIQQSPMPKLSDEQLRVTILSTPQNWNGPFFEESDASGCTVGTMDARKSNMIHSQPTKNHTEELNSWWSSANQGTRRLEFIRHLQPSTSSSSSSLDGSSLLLQQDKPGSSEPATSQTESQRSERLSSALVGVYESLSSYVQGPLEQRKGYFSRFGTPPEWCVDRSGRSSHHHHSFFGEDWGAPPQRLGRDPRYRPLGAAEHQHQHQHQHQYQRQRQRQGQGQGQGRCFEAFGHEKEWALGRREGRARELY